MPGHPDDITREHVAELRIDLEARAAGYWWIAGDWLEQIAFVASPALAEEIAQSFAEATRSVPLDRSDLGIVRAATQGVVVVSRAADLPAVQGSGYWLRAFGATRSVAVPLANAKGTVCAVVSVALANGHEDEDIAQRIHRIAHGWAPLF